MSVDPKTQILFEAIAAQNADLLQRAIELGAPINYPNADGLTPLAVACREGNLDLVDLLVAAGAQMQADRAIDPTPVLPTAPVPRACANERSAFAADESPESPVVDREISFESLIEAIERPTNKSFTDIEPLVRTVATELDTSARRAIDESPEAPIAIREASPLGNRQIAFNDLIVREASNNTTEIEGILPALEPQAYLDRHLNALTEEKPSSPEPKLRLDRSGDRPIEATPHSGRYANERPVADRATEIDLDLPATRQSAPAPAPTSLQQMAANLEITSEEATYTYDLEAVFAANELESEPKSSSKKDVDSEMTMPAADLDIASGEIEAGETYAFDLGPDLDRLTATTSEPPDRLSVPMGEWTATETYMMEGFADLAAAAHSPANAEVDESDRLLDLNLELTNIDPDIEEGETYAIDLHDLDSPLAALSNRASAGEPLEELKARLFPAAEEEDLPDFNADTQTTTDILVRAAQERDCAGDLDTAEDATNTSLMAAIADDDLELVRQAVTEGGNLNRYDWNVGYSPLGMAIDRGHVEIAKYLLDAGANPHCGSIVTTALGVAAERGEAEIVQMLLACGIDVNAPVGRDGWTALLAAIKNGHRSVVQLLVTAGANVNVWSQGETPILLAAKAEEREIYNYLYPLVNTDLRLCADRDGEQLLQATGKRRIRAQNRPVEKFIEMATIGDLEEIERAIEIGIEIDDIGSKGHNALMAAAYYGHRAIVAKLLNAGANPNLLSDEDDLGVAGMTALMLAAGSFFASNRQRIVGLLIDNGAEIDRRDAKGRTALFHAALAGSGYTACVDRLIKAGADLDIRDDRGYTVLAAAAAAENYPMFNLLVQAGASTAGLESVQLIQAATKGDVARVKSLLVTADINIDLDRGAAIGQAAAAGHAEIVELLIKAGANVNLRDRLGFTPLASAAYAGYGEIVHLLLAAGADRQAPTDGHRSFSALEYAQMGLYQFENQTRQHAEIVRMLSE